MGLCCVCKVDAEDDAGPRTTELTPRIALGTAVIVEHDEGPSRTLNQSALARARIAPRNTPPTEVGLKGERV